MIDNNLISYIEQKLNRNYSASAIQNALTNQGYPAQNVLDTINYVQGNNQNTPKTSTQSQNPSKKGLYILIPVVLVIIIGVSLFFFTSLSPKSISEEEFSQGTNFDLKENKEVKFNMDEEVHTIKVDSVSDNSVSLTIQSNPIKADINIGEEKKFDLDNDGFYDIKIKLNNIIDGIPDLYVKKIHESTCVENWNCGNWSDCTEQGTQIRTCTDTNSCGTSKNKPSVTQSCTYVKPCTEDWDCESWSDCTEQGTQTRTCTDINSCGTSKNKPSVTQSCTYVKPCTEDWNCGSWSDCTEQGTQSRTCTDTNSCGTSKNQPATTQSCIPTCSELGGYICSENQVCPGVIEDDASDSDFCCNVMCEDSSIGDEEISAEALCEEKGEYLFSDGDYCEGTLATYYTEGVPVSCCSVPVSEPPATPDNDFIQDFVACENNGNTLEYEGQDTLFPIGDIIEFSIVESDPSGCKIKQTLTQSNSSEFVGFYQECVFDNTNPDFYSTEETLIGYFIFGAQGCVGNLGEYIDFLAGS